VATKKPVSVREGVDKAVAGLAWRFHYRFSILVCVFAPPDTHSNTYYGKDKTIERFQPAAGWNFPSRMAKPFCSWKACGKRELLNDLRIEPCYPADFGLLPEDVSAGLEKW
jgi:hypothetical protein